MDLEKKLMEEYKEVNSNMRHFSNMRLAVLTISLAINGVLIQSVMGKEKTEILVLTGLISLGIISTLCFLIVENRVTYYYLFYHAKAIDLEMELHLNQHNRPRPKKFFNATNATKFLYGTIILFWLVLTIYKVFLR